jgi:hypothetical protein
MSELQSRLANACSLYESYGKVEKLVLLSRHRRAGNEAIISPAAGHVTANLLPTNTPYRTSTVAVSCDCT